MSERLFLEVLDRRVRLESDEPSALTAVEAVFGHMRGESGDSDLQYRFATIANPSITLLRDDVELASESSVEELLWELDGDLAVELQNLRSELFFLHAAVIANADRAYALVAESGGGKSSLCWALLRHGCGYVSDELCPIDLNSLNVHPFPRALSLKSEPGPPLQLPERLVRTSRALYIPTGELPSPVVSRPLRLDAVFCLSYDPSAGEPALRSISAADASTRLYVNSLNPLAHPADGLDAVIRIASGCTCYELVSADLVATSKLVFETIRLRAGEPRPDQSRTE